MSKHRPAGRRAGIIAVGPVPPPVHGAARVTESVINRLRKNDAVLAVFNTASVGTGLRYHASRAWRHVSAAGAVVRLRGTHGVVYVGGAGGKGLWYQAALVATSRLVRSVIYFHHHSFAYIDRPSLAMRVIVAVGGRRCTHIVLCDGMARSLAGGYPAAKKLLVCSNAGLLPPPPESGIDAGTEEFRGVTLCHLSNLSIEKGLAVVLQSFGLLLRQGLEVRLTIAGPAAGISEKALLAQAEQEFGDAFRWLGPIRPEKVPDFFARADLALFASAYLHEAEPLVVLEAARVGTPTVMIDVGCLSSLGIEPSFAAVDVPTFHRKVQETVELLLSTDEQSHDLRRRVERRYETLWSSSRLAHDELTQHLLTATAP